MATTCKYLGEIFNNDNLSKERIQKYKKISNYDVTRKLWKSRNKKNCNASEMENSGSGNTVEVRLTGKFDYPDLIEKKNTLATNQESNISGWKESKERVTVLCCANTVRMEVCRQTEQLCYSWTIVPPILQCWKRTMFSLNIYLQIALP